MSGFLEILKKKIVVFDGSFGALMREMEIPKASFLGKEGYCEILNITKPEIIESVTARYFEAGSDVVQTNTFSASPIKVMEFGFPREKTYPINFEAARLARKIADRYSTPSNPKFIKGSIGPSGFLPSSTEESLNKITYDELVQNFYEQALGLIDGGVDLFIIETQQDILETKATITGLKRAMSEKKKNLPIVCQVTLDTTQKMLLGTDISSVLATLDFFDIDVIGLNCSTGPKEMTDTVRYICRNTSKYVSVIPNAGLPVNLNGKTHYPLTATEMLEQMKRFVYEFGINIVGSCCGSNPEFIKLMADEFRGKKPLARKIQKNYLVSSGMTSVSEHQEPRPLIIGETTNATGSRKFLNCLKGQNYEAVIEMARQQLDSGAHLLDLSAAHNDLERPESEYMARLVTLLSNTVPSPLVIDSTDYKVIEKALKLYPGKAMINSINLEGDLSRIHNILRLVNEFGGAVIGMTIDEDGMAETSEKKFEVAKRIHEIYTKEYGLDPNELFIDTLTFPLTTGEEKYKNSAIATLEAIRKIKKELPGVKTTLGISNVSFGIHKEARKVLNSVFLYHALKYGLDAAIINSSHVIPFTDIPETEKKLFEDLIFNKNRDALQRVIEFYEKKTFTNKSEDSGIDSPVEERLANKIILRKHEKLEETIDEALEKYSAVDIINVILIPSMREVGDRFGRGEYILPFVLEAAGIMKKAVSYLEKYLDKTDTYKKGKLVLATVYGDVHDIGKNLVKTIVSNNGYDVIDLGKQVPVNSIISTAIENKADAIGVSALLVSTSKQMKILVEELEKENHKIPVIIGGASINSRFGKDISFVDGKKYSGGVFYAKSAFDGLHFMNQLTGEQRSSLMDRYQEEQQKAREVVPEATIAGADSEIKPSDIIPEAPFYGHKVLDDIKLDDVYRFLNLDYVFKLHWGVRGLDKDEYDRQIKSTFMPILEKLKKECIDNKYLEPKGVYGYFPCRKQGNSLIILDTEDDSKELCRFDFPRQNSAESLCLSDYFNHDKIDVVAFHVVTVGNKITKIIEDLNEKGDYAKALYLHGLAVETAEAMAEYVNKLVISELGFSKYQGLRYSFGYPACPSLEDQEKLFSLLKAQENVNVRLTESFQMDPEGSTSAIIVYHKDAKYFGS